jgi:hypothetical protein
MADEPVSEEQRLARARDVLQRHKEELMRTYGAVGAGIGKDDPKAPDYVIVVYLESPRQVPEDASVEGVPLRFEVTGRFQVQR